MEADGDEKLAGDVDEAVRGMLGWHGLEEEQVNELLKEAGRRMQMPSGRLRREMDELRRQKDRELRREGHREGHITALCRQAARRFGAEVARKFGGLLAGVHDPERLNEAADAVIDCGGAEELLTRARSLAAAG